MLGAGFEDANSRPESHGRGRNFEFFIEGDRQPIAESGGSDGVDVARMECSGDADAWLAVFGEEGDCGAGVIEERGGLVGLRDAKHEFGLTVARLWWCGQVGSGK